MKQFFAALSLSWFLGTLAPDAFGQADSSWPMYQGNKEHTGYLPISIKPDQANVLFSHQIGSGRALNPVTVADGKVFASLSVRFNDEDQMFVLHSLTGDTIWKRGFGSVNSVNPPSYAYGNVYIQTGNHGSDTYLHAFDAATGDYVFRSPHAAQWERYFAPTIDEGVVYVNGGYYGGMYAFNAYDGTQLWFAGLPQYDQWTPLVGPNYAYAYLGEYQPALYALDKATGAVAFRVDDNNFSWSGWSMNTAPVLGDNGLIYAIHNGRVLAFDPAQPAIHWEKTFSQVAGQPSYHDGVVYARSSGQIFAIDGETGDLLWQWIAPVTNLRSTIIITDSHLIV